MADSSCNILHKCILIFIFYFELCHSFNHNDSDLTSDRFAFILHNRPYMRCLIPEAWYKMARTRTTVATDRTEPNSLRVPQTPVCEDQDIGSYRTFASLRWVQYCISLLYVGTVLHFTTIDWYSIAFYYYMWVHYCISLLEVGIVLHFTTICGYSIAFHYYRWMQYCISLLYVGRVLHFTTICGYSIAFHYYR